MSKKEKIYHCDICDNESVDNLKKFHKVYCKICKKIHYLCSTCYELGHNIDNGKGWS